MIRKIMPVFVLCSVLFASPVFSADVKVMRGLDLIEKGEDCRLITEESAWKITPENARETYSNSTTLRQMTKDGWKIVYVKELPKSYSTEFLFILTKD